MTSKDISALMAASAKDRKAAFEEGRRAGLEEAAERLRITIERAEMAEDERNALKAVLKKLEYWFDTDQEVLDAMTPDERADHMRQLQMIRETLTS